MTTLTARRLLTDIGTVEYPVLEIAPDGTLADISSDPLALAAATDTLSAAFLDIHTHGAVGVDVMSASPQDFSRLASFYAEHGVAHFLPTTVTAPIDATLHALEALADAIEAPPGEGQAAPVGIHLEGPFLSHTKRGVHPAVELQPPSIALFDRFQQAARGHLLLLTLAPEPEACSAGNPGANSSDEPGAPSNPALDPGGPFIVQPHRAMSGETQNSALELIAHATAQGVHVSLGHSDATAAQTLAAIDAGATSATHTFNAMRPLDHREPGIVGTVLDSAGLYAELICDGVHVAPAAVRLWRRSKAPDQAILVTDSMSATGMPAGAYTLGELPVTVRNGQALLSADLSSGRRTLAGSLLTFDRAVSNCQSFTGCSLADAVRYGSHNPARLLGRPELTRLAPGSPANLNRYNAASRLVATYLHGRQVPASRP